MENTQAWVCTKCNGSGYLPEYDYWMDGVCFGCDGKGLIWSGSDWISDAMTRTTKQEVEPSWFSHPALLFYLNPNFRKATKGRQVSVVPEKGEDGSISILSEPVPPDLARSVFDLLTTGSRDKPKAGNIIDGPDETRTFTHAHQNTIWRIRLFTSQAEGEEPFSQIQFLFSPEWEMTARALVKSYLGLFVIVNRKHGSISSIKRVNSVNLDNNHEHYANSTEEIYETAEEVETIDDLSPEGLGVGDVSFQDADSEY